MSISMPGGKIGKSIWSLGYGAAIYEISFLYPIFTLANHSGSENVLPY